MITRRLRTWPATAVGGVVVALGGVIVGCSDLVCPEPELIPVEDGSYRGESESAQAPIREATARIEGEELTLQYVQDTDGRTYRVRLRERG